MADATKSSWSDPAGRSRADPPVTVVTVLTVMPLELQWAKFTLALLLPCRGESTSYKKCILSQNI